MARFLTSEVRYDFGWSISLNFSSNWTEQAPSVQVLASIHALGRKFAAAKLPRYDLGCMEQHTLPP